MGTNLVDAFPDTPNLIGFITVYFTFRTTLGYRGLFIKSQQAHSQRL
jgi:hypothetical protein